MKKLLTYWMPVLICAGIIFYSSSQPYQDQDIKPILSNQLSFPWISGLFDSIAFHYAGEEVSIQKLGAAGFIEFFIRKAAHLFVYFVLSLFVYRAILFTSTMKHRTTTAIVVSLIYAISDEIHQGFTPNRSPHVEDIFIDFVGSILGAMTARSILRSSKRTSR